MKNFADVVNKITLTRVTIVYDLCQIVKKGELLMTTTRFIGCVSTASLMGCVHG
jgi:hypothetical protein